MQQQGSAMAVCSSRECSQHLCLTSPRPLFCCHSAPPAPQTQVQSQKDANTESALHAPKPSTVTKKLRQSQPYMLQNQVQSQKSRDRVSLICSKAENAYKKTPRQSQPYMPRSQVESQKDVKTESASYALKLSTVTIRRRDRVSFTYS